jgi:hypothetical protein
MSENENKIEMSKEELDALIETRVQERLAPIKGKLDNVYQERDTLNAEQAALKEKLEAYEEEQRQAAIKKLEEEGKLKEAYEARLADERSKRETAEREKSQLERERALASRDKELTMALAGLEFKSTKAHNTVLVELREQFSQDDKGLWIHSSGKPLEQVIRDYRQDPDNDYLFKPTTSAGFSQGNSSSTTTSTSTKVGDLAQNELLAKIKSGEIRRQRG